ncbi:hypothetical protein ABIC15_001560 [Exiguobacterium sp. PvP048]|uniref:hypothetical protein n=1 Tax=Exiguobacterium TaxID=33986 RepID=UPI002964DD7E|nr:hypothetical protein [Exiguobacterium sibiricum]MDW2886537.1 hypothetical protein [Exiguobacterium sibiricum]
MSHTLLFVVILLSLVIWLTLSKEVSKSSKEINRPKMLTLLSAGCLSTLILVLALVQR